MISASVAGTITTEFAKIIGITPLMRTFMGSVVLAPPYIFLPTWRFAYCTLRRRSEFEKNTVSTIMSRRTATARKTYRYCIPPILRSAIILRRSGAPLETIFAKRIMEIPLPIPFSSIRSPVHMTSDAPAVRQATITTPANQ